MSSLVSVLPGLWAHASGALWIPKSKTALVADAHLGYSWAQRRRGELGPLVDSQTREKLIRLCDELTPGELVFLGDLVHAPQPCAPEREWIEGTLTELSNRTNITAVRGNHDRAFAREFGHLNVKTVNSWADDSITAIHGDRLDVAIPENHTLVVGHLHPSLPVIDAAGAGQKLPVFLVTPACAILPAFSPFAGGYNVMGGLPLELERLCRKQTMEAYAVTGTRAVRLGPLSRAIERMLASHVNMPSHFRGRRR